MEIEGSVKLLENVHNIWIAWKSAISSQTGYRTRTNIVPKLLKNAVKTVFAFCVFYNGRIYLSIYQAKQRSASYNQCLWNDSHIFVCASLFLHIRLNITCLAHFKVNIKTSFLMYSMGASASKRSPWQIWRYFTIIFLFLVLNLVDGIQLSLPINYDSKTNVHETKNVYISHLLPLSSPHISVNRLHHPF